MTTGGSRRRHWNDIILLSAIPLLLLAASGAGAELAADKKAEAEALISQFSSKEFAARQAAVEKLIAMGPDVRPLVEKALAATTDAEVKLRSEMVLKALNEKFPPPKPTPPEGPEVKIDLTPSRVTLDIKDQTVAEALATLAKATGNAPFTPGDHLAMRQKVSFSVKDKPYWEAVDECCRAAGVAYEATGFNPWRMYRVFSAGPKDEPRAYAGPAAVWVIRAERGGTPHAVRSFRSDPSPGKTNSGLRDFDDPDKLRVNLGFALEHRNFILDSYVLYTKVVAGDGRDLTPPPPQGFAWTARPRLWGERSMMTRTTDLNLAADLAGARVTIEGAIHVDYAVGKKTLKFDNVLGGEHPRATDGPLDITIDGAQKTGRPGEWDVKLRFDDAGKEDGALLDGGRTDYGAALVDPKGVSHKETHGWSRTGRVIGIHFHNVPNIDGEWSLTYTCPVRVESKDYPFVLKDVPLP